MGESDFPFDGSYITTDVSAIKRNLEAAPGGWPGVLNATVRPSSNWVEPRSGGDRPNFDEAWNYWNSVPSDAGDGNFLFGLVVGDGTVAGKPGVVSDNTGVKYQLDLDPRSNRREARFNRDIERVRADWRLRTSLRLNPILVVTGRIHDQMLTLHNLGDLRAVPQRDRVRERSRAPGHSELLVQRAIRGVGHCDFTPTELAGRAPADDVVLDPRAVAAPDYGCRFTDFATPDGHEFPTPCE